jgi:hypothetical protein
MDSSPSSLPANTADPPEQATGREKKVVREPEWGTRSRATTLALPIRGPLGRAPHLHAILREGADDRVNDSQLRSDTESQRHQYGSPRVESLAHPLMPHLSRRPKPFRYAAAVCVSQLQEEVSQMPKYRTWSTNWREEVPQ